MKCRKCGKESHHLTTDMLCEECFAEVIDDLYNRLDMFEEPAVVITTGKIEKLGIMGGAVGSPKKSKLN